MTTRTSVADRGRTWLVRRAERLYGGRLGRFRTSALSWRVAWKWLPVLLLAGFVFGAIAQFTGQPTSSRDPALFSDLPLYVLTSLITGLILWSMTLLWSFRRLLVFDHGLLYGYARKHTARAIFWQDILPGSLRAVEAPPGADADSLLQTLTSSGKTSLGVHGRYAVVFRGTDSGLVPANAAGNGQLRFFTFGMEETPADLVRAIQQAMSDSGFPPAAGPSDSALPPAVVSHVTRLD
jgi:hypothetical protein